MDTKDNESAKIIHKDVLPILKRIEENTRNRARLSQNTNSIRSYGRKSAITSGQLLKTEIMKDSAPILSKREKVAKFEERAAKAKNIAYRSGRIADVKSSENSKKRDSSGRFIPGESKSALALARTRDEKKQKDSASMFSRALQKGASLARNGIESAANGGDAKDAAGQSIAGVNYTALMEIVGAVKGIADTDNFLISTIKNKFSARKDRNEKGQFLSAKANSAGKAEKVQENQQEILQEISGEIKKGNKKKDSRSIIVKGGSGNGGIIDSVLGIGGGKSGSGKGGILSRIGKKAGSLAKGAIGGAGALAGGAGSLLTGIGATAGVSGGAAAAGIAAAGAAGYAAGTVINKGMGALSGALTGGKYGGAGWLGSLIFDMTHSTEELTDATKENTDSQKNKRSGGVFWGNSDGGTAEKTGGFFKNLYMKAKRKITGEKVNTIPGSAGLGGLSAFHESGKRGSEAVGFDPKGGTSYGKYQIATRTGTMKDFMSFIKDRNPEAYKKLSESGPADAGKNGAFAKTWKSLAASGGLGTSEHDFIKATHFDPALQGIENSALRDRIGKSKAMQDVLWSTAVHHGPGGASSIMNKTFKEGMTNEQMISAVYNERGKHFGGSPANVQASVANRLIAEKQQALAMLNQEKTQPGALSPGMIAAGVHSTVPNQTAVINKPAALAPVSVRDEVAKKQEAQSAAKNGDVASLNKGIDKLVAINEKMLQSNSKKENGKDVNNAPDIPTEYDDAQLVLMAHDRA